MPFDPNTSAPMVGQQTLDAPTPAEANTPTGGGESLPAPSSIELPAEGTGAAVRKQSPATLAPVGIKPVVATSDPQVRDLGSNRHLRRLPYVQPTGASPVVGTVTVARIFNAPSSAPLSPDLPADEPLRAAELPATTPPRH
jgi:hypothetical protein